ncbi:peptidylprolyl isomerase [Magnetococcales bacterium HHB-1]
MSGLLRLLLLFIVFISCPSVRAEEVIDRIAAVVKAQPLAPDQEIDPQIITQSDLEQFAAPLLNRLRSSGSAFDPQRIQNKALDVLIMRMLRDQTAQSLKITITEQDLEGVMAKVEQSNGLSVGTLPQALQQQGIDLDRYKDELREKLIQSRIMQRVIRPLIHVSDDELRALYKRLNREKKSSSTQTTESILLHNILLAIPRDATPTKIKQIKITAENLAKQLRAGASFAAIAGQYSQDPSALQGGELGWFKRGELLSELEQVAFTLKKGQISDPIRTRNNFQILKITDRKQEEEEQTSKQLVTHIKARHILVKLAPTASKSQLEDAINRMREVFAQIEPDFSNFAELAKKYSDDKGSAEKGGDLGWLKRGTTVPAFEKAAFAMPLNNISQPVRSRYGLHLILVEDHKKVDAASFEAMKEELKNRLSESKLKARYQQWLRDLHLRAYVERNPPFDQKE